jgi:hypothetical protein
LESFIRWSEDSDVFEIINCGDEVRGRESAGEGGELAVDCGIRRGEGHGEDGVEDVDYAAVEHYVCGCDGGFFFQAREDLDGFFVTSRYTTMSAHSPLKERGRKGREKLTQEQP